MKRGLGITLICTTCAGLISTIILGVKNKKSYDKGFVAGVKVGVNSEFGVKDTGPVEIIDVEYTVIEENDKP